jgi:MarR family transcriptional regulator, organic hydroperoxide resistance regulator
VRPKSRGALRARHALSGRVRSAVPLMRQSERQGARGGAVPTLRNELQLHYLLFQLANKLRLLLLDAIRPYGVTVPRFRALQQLFDHGGMRLTDLATECAIEQSAMTHVVTQLAKAGLVTRGRSTRDNRTVMVKPTAKGRELYARMAVEAMRIHVSVTRDLSDADRKKLALLLRLMMRNADTMHTAIAAPGRPRK